MPTIRNSRYIQMDELMGIIEVLDGTWSRNTLSLAGIWTRPALRACPCRPRASVAGEPSIAPVCIGATRRRLKTTLMGRSRRKVLRRLEMQIRHPVERGRGRAVEIDYFVCRKLPAPTPSRQAEILARVWIFTAIIVIIIIIILI